MNETTFMLYMLGLDNVVMMFWIWVILAMRQLKEEIRKCHY